MRPPALAVFLLVMPAACGARTTLHDPDPSGAVDSGVDALPPDVPPPSCGTPTPVGQVRFTAAGITGPVAIAADGTIYAPRRSDGNGRELVAFDACGRELWSRPGLGAQSPGATIGGEARLTTGDDVLLTNSSGLGRAYGIWRYGRDGTARTPYPLIGSLSTWAGLPAGGGPVIHEYRAGGGGSRRVAFDLAGRLVTDVAGSLQQDACGVRGNVVGCSDGAFLLPSGTSLWQGEGSLTLLDGTHAHPVSPALDASRIYFGLFGVRTYLLVARDLRTGAIAWQTTLGTSTRGQTDLLFGGPVLGAGGMVYVYLNIHREPSPPGELYAVHPDGSRAWSFPAPATRQDFFHYATHLVGRGGMIYLAVGTALHALGEDGVERWSLAVPAGLNAAAPALSPNGDLALHTDDDRLIVVATGSPGLADTPWPAPGGDARNGDAR